MKNRILALALVISVGISMFSVLPASANENQSKAVRLLTELNIIKEDAYTGDFWDESPVKRFEIAQILCNLFGYNTYSDAERKFVDVSDEDRAYIETVVRNGLMSGYGDMRFGPNDYVTYEQVIKIFTDVAGGTDLAFALGGYPDGYIKAARRLGIGKGINVAIGSVARRIDVAEIVYDAIHADMVSLEGYSEGNADYTIIEGESILSEMLNIKIVEGVLASIDATSVNRPVGTGVASVQVGDTVITDDEHLADDYLGCKVVAYVKEDKSGSADKLIYIEEADENTTITINGDDFIDVTKDKLTYYDGDKEKEARISVISDMIYNGKSVELDITRLKKSSDMTIKLIDNTGDKNYDVISVNEYQHYVIDSFNADGETIYLKFGEKPIVLKDNFVKVFLDGERITSSDLKAGMIISVAASEGEGTEKAIRIEGCSLSVLGTADRLWDADGGTYISVQNKSYKLSDTAFKLAASNYIPEIKAGVSGQFYLNIFGEVVYISSGNNSGNVGYLVAVAKDDSPFSSGLTFKIYTDKAKMEIFKTGEKLKVNGSNMKTDDFAKGALGMMLFDEVSGRQLISYEAEEDVITELNFCSITPNYDSAEFSLDVAGKYWVRKQNVLNNIYTVDSDTKVFYVPTDGDDAINKYGIYTGSYFRRDREYDVKLYEIAPNGKVGYVVIPWVEGSTSLDVTNPIFLVTDITEGLSSENEVINVLEGYNTNGQKATLMAEDADLLCDSSDNTKKVEKGDVIQYALDSENNIKEIKIVKKISDNNHYGFNTVHSYDKQVSFGYAANVSSSNILISTTVPNGQINPNDAASLVSNTGSAVFIYYKDRSLVVPAKFSDVVSGDEVFACSNASNTTLMMIIYR